MWLRSVRRRTGSTRAIDALALVQLALDRLEHERLVVADAHDVEHARGTAAVLALDHAVVVDLAAARGIDGDSTSLASTRPFSLASAATAVACSIVS